MAIDVSFAAAGFLVEQEVPEISFAAAGFLVEQEVPEISFAAAGFLVSDEPNPSPSARRRQAIFVN